MTDEKRFTLGQMAAVAVKLTDYFTQSMTDAGLDDSTIDSVLSGVTKRQMNDIAAALGINE